MSHPGGYSNMKLTYMCLPEYEKRGHSVPDFVEKWGSFVVGSKNGPFLHGLRKKWRSFSVGKYNFDAKICIFFFFFFLRKLPLEMINFFKCAQNFVISV